MQNGAMVGFISRAIGRRRLRLSCVALAALCLLIAATTRSDAVSPAECVKAQQCVPKCFRDAKEKCRKGDLQCFQTAFWSECMHHPSGCGFNIDQANEIWF